MLPAAMTRRPLLALFVLPAMLVASGCGEKGIDVAKDDPLYQGAVIFNQRCGGCHTLDQGGTEGSAVRANSREYKDGPNFNQRKEQYQDVLYAIRNGGFSSGPMPQNIVVGRQAELVACFIATNSGQQAQRVPDPKKAVTGSGPETCKQDLAQK
jgi:mono/diheme cytochrome c family protein